MDSAVFEVLQQATSQDPEVLKPAEETLKQWETQRGFYTALYNVLSNHSLAVNVRWMAIVCFKNGVERYWRKTAPNAIDEQEKEFLRQRLISEFNEPVSQLAVQLAVLIAKIARFDCPREWTALIPTLLEGVRNENSLVQHRALLTLHQVIKTLASKRLSGDRVIFQQLNTNVFSFILNLWNSHTEAFLFMISNNADANQIQEAMEKALLLLRILRKLVIHGFDAPSESQDGMLFLKVIFERARNCLECRKTLMTRGIHMEVCDKFIIHLTKVLLGILELYPLCYIDLIPTSLEFATFYCFTEAGSALCFERFIIQNMNLMKGILQVKDQSISKFASAVEMPYERKVAVITRLKQMKEEFFTADTLKEICRRLVNHYFLLTPAELEMWDSDPENAIDDEGESWKYNMRACTQSLFVTIFHDYRDVLAPVLVEMMQRHHQPVDPNDTHAILLKDAVYNAVGLVGFDLYDEVNFDQWFSTTLKQELKMQSVNYKIIRRRVCWLIGQWIGIKLSAELRPDLYQVMVEALSPEEDLGVRLAASNALKLAIDDFMFSSNEFMPYLEPACSLLFTLLKEVNECITKMRVLDVISFIIERYSCFGSQIIPHIGLLSAYLPVLWQESEGHNLLRCAILSTLVHLEQAAGSSENVMIRNFVVSTVAFSCDINQEGHVYLLEDGLELWLALLNNATEATPAILDLARYMPPLLETTTENLIFCLSIINAYVVLSPHQFLTENGTVILNTLKDMLSDLGSQGVEKVLEIFEVSIIAAPQQGIEIIRSTLPKILQYIYDDSMLPQLSVSLSIISRILLISKDIFAQAISEFTRLLSGNLNEDAVLGQIIHIWVLRMTQMGQKRQRKLYSLAFCSLLAVNSPPCVMQRFTQIITNIVETLNDISTVDDMGCISDSLIMNASRTDDDDYYFNEHTSRERKLAAKDPVLNLLLKDTLQTQLSNLRQAIGNNQFDQLLLTLPPDIDKQLKEYVSL